jgi:signal transduction histidine kinase
MDVAWLRSRLRTDDPAIEQRWERIQHSLDQGVDFKRRVVEDLRPTLLDNMGLFAALRWQFEDTCSRASLEYRERLPQEELPISSEAAIALFRTAQEALTNILKHARATRVFLTVEVDPTHLRMVVGDNGRGIPSPEDATLRGHGLAGMRHRIAALDGQWQVRRRELGGTEVVVEVLLANILLPPEAAPATPPVQPPPETNAIGVAEGDSAPSTGPLPRTG